MPTKLNTMNTRRYMTTIMGLIAVVALMTTGAVQAQAQTPPIGNIDTTITKCSEGFGDSIDINTTFINRDSQEYRAVYYTLFLHDQNGVKLTSKNSLTTNLQPQLSYYEEDFIRYSGTWDTCSVEITRTTPAETPTPPIGNIDTTITKCSEGFGDSIDINTTFINRDSQEYRAVYYTLFLHDQNGVKLTSKNSLTTNLQPQLSYYEEDFIRYSGTWDTCSVEITRTTPAETPTPPIGNIDTTITKCSEGFGDSIDINTTFINRDSQEYRAVYYTLFLHDQNGVKLTSKNSLTTNLQPQLSYYEEDFIRYSGTWDTCSVEITRTTPAETPTPPIGNIDTTITKCSEGFGDSIDINTTFINRDSQEYRAVYYTLFLHDQNGVKLTSKNSLTTNLQPQLSYYEEDFIRYSGTWDTCSVEITRTTPAETPTPPVVTPPTNNTNTQDTTPFDQAYVDTALKQQQDILQAEYNTTLNTLQEKYNTLQEKYNTLQENYNTLQETYDTLYATIEEINRVVNLIIALYS